MLTLDRLALRAPPAGAPPYRNQPWTTPVRVELPPPAEERRRALRLFAHVVGMGVTFLTGSGLVASHGLELVFGPQPAFAVLLRSLLWYAGFTGAFFTVFTGVGLLGELRRYRHVRARVGPRPYLRPDGWLVSADGTTQERLVPSPAMCAPGFRDGLRTRAERG